MKKIYSLLFIVMLFFTACEEPIDIEVPNPEEKLVVEATIESGSFPVVLVTRSANFYSSFDLDNLTDLIVSGAEVTINDGSNNVQLQEITVDTINGVQLVVYVGLNMVGEEGKTYTLTVKKDDKILTATTTIPMAVPLDSVFYEVDSRNDSFVQLRGRITDPAGVANFYRYATARNGGPVLFDLNSVVDDAFFDGQSFPFPMNRGYDPDEENLPWGLYRKGDTATVKWCAINRQTYNFYRSVEYQRQSTGNPFSNITRIESNVQGGLGVFAGSACREYTIIIPE